MLSNVLHDVELVEALGPTLVPMQGFLAEAVEILAAGWRARGRRRRVLAAALRHALDFQTWRSLAAEGAIARADAVELSSALVQAAAAPPHRTAAQGLEVAAGDGARTGSSRSAPPPDPRPGRSRPRARSPDQTPRHGRRRRDDAR
jgi:hypothetical protein